MRVAPWLLPLLLLAGALRAEGPIPVTPPAFTEEAAFLGLCGLPVKPRDGRGAGPLERLAGLGVAWGETVPVAWGTLDPRPPDHPVARYDWQGLDDTLRALERAGVAPLLVLSPACAWASVPRGETDFARAVRERLPAADALLAVEAATGAAPPQPGAWKEWQRFVRDLVERYDGDGQRDMPGLGRPLRALQVLDQVERGTRWLGSADEYLRLLHHAKEAVGEAQARVEVVHAAVDLHGLFLPGPDDADGWKRRLEATVPVTPPMVRLEVERGLEIVERALGLPLAYDALPHVGHGHLAWDERNLAALRRRLDERGSTHIPVWLTQSPTRRLEEAPAPVPSVQIPAEEARLRARLLSEAVRAGEETPARRWLRRGTAFDLVRGAARARAAGATRVLTYGLTDDPLLVPGDDGPATRLQGFLAPLGGAAGAPALAPTPSWYAARQMNRLLLGHRTARPAPLGTAGTAVVFGFGEQAPLPWVAVLLPEAAPSWAGDALGAGATHLARVPLPDGDVELEEVALTDGPVSRRRETVREGLLTLTLGPAPLYVLPAAIRR